MKNVWVSEDGSLLSNADNSVVRANYVGHHTFIQSLHDLKATIRAGRYTDRGSGYEVHFCTQDGATLCYEAVVQEFRQIVNDWMHDADTGWRVNYCGINFTHSFLQCDHTGYYIPREYGDPQTDPE